MEKSSEGDKVLHLAGLSALVRRVAFREGLEALCHAATRAALKAEEYTSSSENEQNGINDQIFVIPKQMGLHRNRLSYIVFDTSLQRQHIERVSENLRHSRRDITGTISELRDKYRKENDKSQSSTKVRNGKTNQR